MKTRPLWDLLNKSLTQQEQKLQSLKNDEQWQPLHLSAPAQTNYFLPRIYLVFTYTTQSILFHHPSIYTAICCLVMWSITSILSPRTKTAVYPRDVLLVVVVTCVLVPVLPFVFSQVNKIGYFTVPAMIVYVIFGEEGEEGVGLSEIVMIAAVMLEAAKIKDVEGAILFVNLSLGLFVWKPWRFLSFIQKTNYISDQLSITIALTSLLLLGVSLQLAIGFVSSVSIAAGVCISASYLRSYQLKYVTKWQLPEVNSYR